MSWLSGSETDTETDLLVLGSLKNKVITADRVGSRQRLKGLLCWSAVSPAAGCWVLGSVAVGYVKRRPLRVPPTEIAICDDLDITLQGGFRSTAAKASPVSVREA